MTDNLNLTEKEFLILQMLINASIELYGLQMVSDSQGKLKKGTIYVTLGRLEDKGYIESRKEVARPNERGLPRRLYKATGLGSRVFDMHCQFNELKRAVELGVVNV
ncbi:MAG: PadR family transcriptional regulator [Algicola sp.]|nr:PadR family transcriptional regulator [Algicola sp.]